MQAGIVGLGRMGMNMARRLLQGGHEVVAYNRTAAKTEEINREGALGVRTLEEFAEKLSAPRVVWMMLPAGVPVDEHVELFSGMLSSGDILVDGGNSFYKDAVRRCSMLAGRGIQFLDAGVSGGIWGLEIGYCTMIGGHRESFDRIRPILDTLAPKDGYLYCGPSGAGHFVKMVHNGIEYAMMQAYGEGFHLIQDSPYADSVAPADLSRLWNRGSVVRSWLLELLEKVFSDDPDLSAVKAYIEDSGEGRWTVQQAVETGTPVPVMALALFQRFGSRIESSFADRVLAALRKEFGGHKVYLNT